MRRLLFHCLFVFGKNLENVAGPYEEWTFRVDDCVLDEFERCIGPYDPEFYYFKTLIEEGAFTEEESPTVSLAMWMAGRALEDVIEDGAREAIGRALSVMATNDVRAGMDVALEREYSGDFTHWVLQQVRAGWNPDEILDWPHTTGFF